VNQLKAPPFNEVGNTRHRTVLSEVYKLICVVYTFMCSLGSVVPSCRSMLKPFHTVGSCAPIMSSVNGFRRDTSRVLVVRNDLFIKDLLGSIVSKFKGGGGGGRGFLKLSPRFVFFLNKNKKKRFF